MVVFADEMQGSTFDVRLSTCTVIISKFFSLKIWIETKPARRSGTDFLGKRFRFFWDPGGKV
jgi:hypothetical protein